MTNEQLNGIIDGYMRPEAERIRAMKAQIVAERAAIGSYTDYAESADPITLTRTDAATLPTLASKDLRDYAYALDGLYTALAAFPDTLLAKFQVRNLDAQ